MGYFQLKKNLLSVTPKSIEYSLNVYLTWFKLLKNSNDIQDYGNMFAASRNILNSSMPPGFHCTIDSQSFNIMRKYLGFFVADLKNYF